MRKNQNDILYLISRKYKISEERLKIKEDGRIMWLCCHGIEHTVYNPNDVRDKFMHECDYCCGSFDKIDDLRMDLWEVNGLNSLIKSLKS